MFDKLYRKYAIEEHRKMWNWITHQTYLRKEKVKEWEYVINLPRWKRKIIERHNNCFICASVKEKCDVCPFIRTDRNMKDYCIYKDSFYYKWYKENKWDKAMDYAIDISNLPR